MFPIILISCLGIIVYSNAFFCSFHLDDIPSIVQNTFIRNIFDLHHLWDFLPRRFFLYLSLAFNYRFNGLDVFGYHLFNLIVHLISAVLVWWLVLLTLSTPVMKGDRISRHVNTIALFAGLIFVSHPIQTEAVTYIVQRAASMATMFYLASLCFYVKSRLMQESVIARSAFQRSEATKQSFKKIASLPMVARNDTVRKLYYISSLIAAIMAMFTKEIAITLPLMILLYETYFLRNKKYLNWKPLIPYLFILFIIPITMYFTESPQAQHLRGVQADGPAGISCMHYLFTQFRVMVTYIRLICWPIHQNLDYDYPISKSIFELPVLSSLLFLASILYLAKFLFSKYRLVSFSVLWFFLTLLPESSIFPIRDVIFEHRLYLPMVGYGLFLTSASFYILEKNGAKVMVILLSMVIACYSVLTYQRNKVWKDEITLWNDVVARSPHKARPHYNRGSFYLKEGDLIRAMADLNKAIEIDPNYAEAYNNRGNVYYREDNGSQALRDYNKAIEMKSYYAEVYTNRGNLYKSQGNLTQALSDYTSAIELGANFSDVYDNRGIIYAMEGDLTQERSDFNRAIEINTNDPVAYNNRGHIYMNEGKFTQAISDLTLAIEINPKYADAYNNRAVAYYALNEYDKALKDVRKAQELGVVVNPHFINDLQNASGQSL